MIHSFLDGTLQAKHVANPHLLSAIHTLWYTFDKYYSLTDNVTAYALLLAPHRRKAYMARNWKRE
jgi:hypothetical protein